MTYLLRVRLGVIGLMAGVGIGFVFGVVVRLGGSDFRFSSSYLTSYLESAVGCVTIGPPVRVVPT